MNTQFSFLECEITHSADRALTLTFSNRTSIGTTCRDSFTSVASQQNNLTNRRKFVSSFQRKCKQLKGDYNAPRLWISYLRLKLEVRLIAHYRRLLFLLHSPPPARGRMRNLPPDSFYQEDVEFGGMNFQDYNHKITHFDKAPQGATYSKMG